MALKIWLLILKDSQDFPKDGEELCPITPEEGWLVPGTADRIDVSFTTNFLMKYTVWI